MKRNAVLMLTGVLLALLALVGGAAAGPISPPVDGTTTLTGILTVVDGDPQPGADATAAPQQLYLLHLPDGRALRLLPGDVAAGELAESDLARLNRSRVTVTVAAAEVTATESGAAPGATIGAITLAPGAAPATTAVTGNTRWITVACKFANVTDEPRTVDFFRQMYRNEYPGLDHYWRQASYDHVNLVGSDAAGWFGLPGTRNSYVPGGVYADLAKLFNDCTAAADAAVNFAAFDGINLVFNDFIGAFAWGGSWNATLDGVSKTFRTTWLPPWGYLSLSATQHEMGHSYGMPHSGSAAGETYSNVWDVMGRPGIMNCHLQPDADPVFGCVERNPLTWHREIPGWLDDRVYVAGPGEHQIFLESATNPAGDGYLLARIPIDDEGLRFYTVEARSRVGYDKILPGDAVVIHEVNRTRANPAWVIDPCPPDGFCPGDSERAMLRPGETMALEMAAAAVRVDAAENNGYRLTIVSGAEVKHVELAPVADAYVRSSAGGRNFGGAAELLVGPNGTIDTYLDFGPLPEAVFSAQLRLTAAANSLRGEPGDYVTSSNGFFKGSATPWTESGLTWNNAPKTGTGGWGIPQTTFASDRTEWDLWFTQFWGTPHRTLVISNGWRDVATNRYSSREGANPPRLILDFIDMPDGGEPPGETHTFTPTNDAHVLQAKPKNVFGAKPVLQVKDAAKDVNTFIKFNVNSLSGTVQSATLRLYVKDPGPDGGQVYAVSPFYLNTTTLWLETGLKWNNAPAISGAPLGTVGNAAAGQWVEVDVTAAVVAALGNNGRVSLAITNDSTNLVSYGSKESAQPPELVVITN